MLKLFNSKRDNVLLFSRKLRRERIPSRQSQRSAHLLERYRSQENWRQAVSWWLGSVRLAFLKCVASLLLVFLRIEKGLIRLLAGIGMFCAVLFPIIGIFAFYGHWKVKPDFWFTGFKVEGYALAAFMVSVWLQMLLEIAEIKLLVMKNQALIPRKWINPRDL